MWHIIKKLSLGIFLIALASGILLYSDWKSRRDRAASDAKAATNPAAEKTFRVALVQHASQPVLNDGSRGMVDGLAEKGFVDGARIKLQKFIAEGDLPTAAAIAKNVTAGEYDMVLTVSTVSLQSVANANKAGLAKHVFALVTDPYGAGVGINRTNHLDHPKHLAGYGTMQPVAESFRIAKQMRPELKTVGVVWNPAEANSEAQLKLARIICQELGIELMEASIDNSSGVFEAVNALISRGIEAIWVSGDIMVLTSFDALASAAKRAGIPAFTVIPPHSERGALFDIGADYHEVGRLAGHLAAEILDGRDPATVSIENLMPETIVINKKALAGLKQEWRIPEELLKRAKIVIDDNGRTTNAAVIAKAALPVAVATKAPATNAPATKHWRIHLINYNDSAPAEEVVHGIMDGYKKSGLVEGKDYTVKHRNAQGDVATLNNIFDAAISEGADMFHLLSTPTLQTAVKKVKNTPVIFAFVANPMIAGAAQDYTNHLPNITGVSSLGAFKEMVDVLVEHFPQYKRVGTLFCPAEINSVHNKNVFVQEANARGITVETVPVNTASDLPDASAAMCDKQIDAVVQIMDNLNAAGFVSIARAAQRSKLPLLSFNSSTITQGAAVTVSRDFYAGGEESAELAVRVMRGESPAGIPISRIRKLRILANPDNAAALGFTLPESFLNTVDEVIRQ